MESFIEFTLYTKAEQEFKTFVNKRHIIKIDKNPNLKDVIDVTMINTGFSIKGNYEDIKKQLNSK